MIVVEMGMRGLGQIEQLCSFVKPDWGLITNVGESHIELLGSRENIARAKAELIASLPNEGGVAFLNAADDTTDFVWDVSGKAGSTVTKVVFDGSGANLKNTLKTKRTRARRSALSRWDKRSKNGVFSSKQGHSQQREPSRQAGPCVWAEEVTLDSEGYPSFVLCAAGFNTSSSNVDRMKCSLSLRGVHNVSNACSAAAVGYAAGMNLEEIVAALEASQPESGRQEILHSDQGFIIINDAYNANPDSVRASLSLLKAMQFEGRRLRFWAIWAN